MTSHEILKADLLDILFEKRNKQYGAYTLRRHYHSRLSLSLGLSLSTIFLLFFFLKPEAPLTNDPEPEKKVVHVIQIDPLPLKPPPPPVRSTPPPRPNVAQSSLTQRINLVENPDPDKELKPVEEIKLTAISAGNVPGDFIPEVQTLPGAGQPTASGPANDREETRFVPLEKSPEFPGGREAWAKFLNRYLRTPEDLEAGEKKVVVISFLVDVDGSVTGFKVVRSGGNSFDNEVIRVLNKMPKWKPAIQNGHPVAVPFTQPVTFVGLEQ